MCLPNCALFNAFFVYKTLHTHKKKIKCKNFLHKIARSQISEVQNPRKSSSDELKWTQKQPTPREPKQDTPSRLSGDFSKHKLEKK